MMPHQLPSNPMTISDQRPQADTWDAKTILDRYEGRPLFVEELVTDLRELRRWDSFLGVTSPNREEAKEALKNLLALVTLKVYAEI